MARIVIDPTTQEYQRHLTRFIDAIDFMRPSLRHYYTLNEDEQQAWRQADPLLRRMVIFVERFASMSEEV